MRRIIFVLALTLAVGGSAVYAASILGHGEEYQAMMGFNGALDDGNGNVLQGRAFDVPYMGKAPTIDGKITTGEWSPAFYTEFGPSTLAGWAKIHGYISNEPGNVATDGLHDQLGQSEGENAAEARTDADMYARVWSGWDENYIYQAFHVTDNIYDATGTQDIGFWEKDGFFFEIDFLNTGTKLFSSGAVDYSAMPLESARHSITYWWHAPDAKDEGTNFLYGDDPGVVQGSSSGFSLVDDGWYLETRTSWAFLSSHLAGGFTPRTGFEFTNSYHIIDPDGDNGFGGQFQFGRGPDAGDSGSWAEWALVGGPGATAVESTTWGTMKKFLR